MFVDLWPFAAAERFGTPGDFCELLFAGPQALSGAGESSWTRPDYLRLICAGGYPGCWACSPLATGDLGATLYFYRDRDGREIDFLLERRNGQVVAIEVKASSTVGSNDFRHLRWLADRLGDRFGGGYVLHLGDQTHPFGHRMMALPLSAMWRHAR